MCFYDLDSKSRKVSIIKMNYKKYHHVYLIAYDILNGICVAYVPILKLLEFHILKLL